MPSRPSFLRLFHQSLMLRLGKDSLWLQCHNHFICFEMRSYGNFSCSEFLRIPDRIVVTGKLSELLSGRFPPGSPESFVTLLWEEEEVRAALSRQKEVPGKSEATAAPTEPPERKARPAFVPGFLWPILSC